MDTIRLFLEIGLLLVDVLRVRVRLFGVYVGMFWFFQSPTAPSRWTHFEELPGASTPGNFLLYQAPHALDRTPTSDAKWVPLP